MGELYGTPRVVGATSIAITGHVRRDSYGTEIPTTLSRTILRHESNSLTR